MRRLFIAFLFAGLATAPALAQSRPGDAPEPSAGTPVRPQIPVSKSEPGGPDIPSRRAECAWTGQRIIGLLWRDDVITAREQSRFYEMFGCPAAHLPVAFRCVIEQSETQPENADLNARVYGCWMSPQGEDPKE